MRKIDSGAVGIARGEIVLFSDFADDGAMWAGSGDREIRRRISFDEPFAGAPVVSAWITMQDVACDRNTRFDLAAEDEDPEGFTIVFRTWGDSRIARIRVGWMAIGTVRSDDMWDID